MVEGEYLFQVGDEKQTLKAGDTIFLPRKVPYTWLQLSDNGKLIYFLQPAGTLEDFFKKTPLNDRPPSLDWLSVAIDLGYYDYQHLVRDFKEFTQLTPNAFLEADTKSPERVSGITEM